MSLANLKKYFKKNNIPKAVSDYVLGDVDKLNYSDYSYFWENLAKNTKKEMGIDSDYLSRALFALYQKDSWNFTETVIEIFGKKKDDTKKLIDIMKTEIGMTIGQIGKFFYESYRFKGEFATNFSNIIYENNKDDLIDILKVVTNGSYFPNLISFLSKVDYDYYEIEIKNHLTQHFALGASLYESLQYVKDEEYKDAFVLKYIEKWSDYKGYDAKLRDSIINFIENNEKDKFFDKAVKKMDKKRKLYDYYRFSELFMPKNMENMTEFENRVFSLSLDLDLYKSLDLVFDRNKRTYTYAKKHIDANRLSYIQVLEYFLNENISEKQFKNFMENDKDNTLNALKEVPNAGQSLALPMLFKFNKDLTYDFIWDILPTAKSGLLKSDIPTYLLKFKDKKDEIKKEMISNLSSKKINVREIALDYIMKTYDKKDEALLKEFLEKEKSDKVKKIVVDFFVEKKIAFSDSSTTAKKGKKSKDTKELVLFSKEWFIYSSKNAKKKNLGWLDLNSLPKLHYKDNSEQIGEKELFYFINIAATEKAVIPNEQIKKFGELVKESDLTEFAKKMYEVWDRQAKTKWALVYAAAFGDNSLIKPLRDEILKFVDYGRGAIAAQMVEAIAMIGTTDAFQTVDWFTKKVRHKQVKRAANEALVTAARELNITKEELLDKIIPNFGFNEDGIINLDFGPRQFEVKLTPDLSFLITDNNGKSFKNLPKPGKTDDNEKASQSSDFFKNLKKDVKTQVKLQKNRLENGFSSNRLWKFENWRELFIKNPMMKQFALTLVWGVYDDKGGLVKGFRFLEDGSFANIEEEEIKLKDNEKIGLIHPIELKAENLEAWKEQLDDYEIVQSFEQLNRTIYRVTKENQDKLQLEDFMGYIIYKSSLKNKLFNKGWERGSVQDAGCYYEYYKDLEGSGISVELNFGGDCMYDDGDTPIKEIVFYKSGTVQRGSYMYDKPAGGDTFSLKQIPERLYSEIYHEIKTIADSGKGFEEGWEKKDYW